VAGFRLCENKNLPLRGKNNFAAAPQNKIAQRASLGRRDLPRVDS
jgi:hypothetical protein